MILRRGAKRRLTSCLAIKFCVVPGHGLALPLQAVEMAERKSFSVASIRSDLTGSDDVGSRSAGVMCVPAGSLSWRDLAFNPVDSASIVARSLSEAGLDIEKPDDNLPELGHAPAEYLLVLTIQQAKIKACAPQWGVAKLLSGGRKLKGSVTLTVKWDVYKTVTRTIVASFLSEQTTAFKGSDTNFASMLKAGLVQSTAMGAPKLKLLGAVS